MDDKQWFETHINELRKDYEGKLVAVLAGEIVAVGDDLEEVAREIERLKRDGKLKGVPFTGRVGDDMAAVHIPSIFA